MKIIRQVYQDKYSSGNGTGFGDFIRGTYTLWQICKQEGYDLRLHFRNHPTIGSFLEGDDSEVVKSSVPVVSHYFDGNNYSTRYNNLVNFLKQDLSEINLYTYLTICEDRGVTLWTIQKLPDDFRNFIKSKLVKTSSFQSLLDSARAKLPEKYSVIHIRVGDPVGNREIPSSQFQKIESIIQRHKFGSNSLVISDNSLVRDQICSKYNFYSLGTKVCHTMDDPDNLEAVQDTLLEFFLIGSASQVYQITTRWPSGFGFWSAKIHNVPISGFHI